MKIIIGTPPNYKDIVKAFNPPSTAVFTFGDTIYTTDPENIISDHLIVHEETHQKQQDYTPGAWWTLYITDPSFRLTQEVEAYHNQYEFYKTTHKDRNEQAIFLNKLASDLSGKVYGNIISFWGAYERIKNG